MTLEELRIAISKAVRYEQSIELTINTEYTTTQILRMLVIEYNNRLVVDVYTDDELKLVYLYNAYEETNIIIHVTPIVNDEQQNIKRETKLLSNGINYLAERNIDYNEVILIDYNDDWFILFDIDTAASFAFVIIDDVIQDVKVDMGDVNNE